MSPARPPRPNELIDALDEMPRESFDGIIWRVVRSGRDVLQGGRPGGRWDDGTFDILYSCLESDGAVAEIYFHVSKGQPVPPSRVKYFVYKLEVRLSSVLDLSDSAKLRNLGIAMGRFGRLSYLKRDQEYPTTQQIGEVAHFLGFDGIKVPCARWPCENLILFTGRIPPENIREIDSNGPLDWVRWAKQQG